MHVKCEHLQLMMFGPFLRGWFRLPMLTASKAFKHKTRLQQLLQNRTWMKPTRR